MPVTSNLDAGLKYRYFRTGKLNFNDNVTTTDAAVAFASSDHFSSHSLLASLIYNFGARASAPAPVPAPVYSPPPQPAAPATQVCPDGTTILATDSCPVPPPPPPPAPPPSGERG